MAKSYKWLIRGLAVGLPVTIVGGVAVALFVAPLSGSGQRSGNDSSQQQSAPSDHAFVSTSPSSTPAPTTVAQPPSTPDVFSTPAPLDNKVITQARVVVVGDKISPTVWSAESVPGYYATVFTAAGEITADEACYVHWELYNNGVLLTTADTNCGLEGGWSTSFWPNGTHLDPGTVKVTGSITTDWGATSSAEADFTVQ
jgi:hypothetical protein